MKKLLVLLLTVLMAMSLVACTQNEEPEQGTPEANLPNPLKEVSSLDEVNELAGINIVAPGVAGKSDEKYFVIESNDATLGQYVFTVGGYKYTLRGANYTADDISGIYDDNNEYNANEDIIIYTNKYKLDRFFVGETQYTLYVEDNNELDEETFCNIALEIEQLVKGNNGVSYQGSYQDSVSQRAMADVVETSEGYNIVVSWSSSATEYTTWTMDAQLNGDKLEYKGELIEKHNGDDVETTASNNVGYFEIVDGKLCWTGAALEECQTCVFEKIPE